MSLRKPDVMGSESRGQGDQDQGSGGIDVVDHLQSQGRSEWSVIERRVVFHSHKRKRAFPPVYHERMRMSGRKRGRCVGMSRQVQRRFLREFMGHGSVLVKEPSFALTLTAGKEAPGWQEMKRLRHVWRQRIARVPGLLEALTGYGVAELQERGAVHYHEALAVVGGEVTGHRERYGVRYPVIRFGDIEDVVAWLGEQWLQVSGLQGSTARARRRYGWHGSCIHGVDGLGAYVAKVAGEIAKSDQKSGQAFGRTWFKWDRGKRLSEYCTLREVGQFPEEWVRRKMAVAWVGQCLGIRVVEGKGRRDWAYLSSDELGSAAAYVASGAVEDLVEWGRVQVLSRARRVQDGGEVGKRFVVWDAQAEALVRECHRFSLVDELGELMRLIDAKDAAWLRSARESEFRLTYAEVARAA